MTVRTMLRSRPIAETKRSGQRRGQLGCASSYTDTCHARRRTPRSTNTSYACRTNVRARAVSSNCPTVGLAQQRPAKSHARPAKLRPAPAARPASRPTRPRRRSRLRPQLHRSLSMSSRSGPGRSRPSIRVSRSRWPFREIRSAPCGVLAGERGPRRSSASVRFQRSR
jgi:hypothetical protein